MLYLRRSSWMSMWKSAKSTVSVMFHGIPCKAKDRNKTEVVRCSHNDCVMKVAIILELLSTPQHSLPWFASRYLCRARSDSHSSLLVLCSSKLVGWWWSSATAELVVAFQDIQCCSYRFRCRRRRGCASRRRTARCAYSSRWREAQRNVAVHALLLVAAHVTWEARAVLIAIGAA